MEILRWHFTKGVYNRYTVKLIISKDSRGREPSPFPSPKFSVPPHCSPGYPAPLPHTSACHSSPLSPIRAECPGTASTFHLFSINFFSAIFLPLFSISLSWTQLELKSCSGMSFKHLNVTII